MAGFVYILEDENTRYYIGSCQNINKRFKRHLGGWVYTTHRMKNPRVVLIQEYSTIQEAKKVELKLKKLKRKDYIRKMVEEREIKIKP